MVKRIVGGNDIYVKWTILKNSGTTFSTPSVVLYDSFKKKYPFAYEIQDLGTSLLITGKYSGKDQRSFGMYHLVFYNNYNEDNMNSLVYRNAFVLIHALKNGISSYGDYDADEAITVELDSDLSVALVDQSITDREDIIQSLSQLTLKNDEQDSKLNDISTHLDSSISYLIQMIDDLSIGSLQELLSIIEDDEQVLVHYFDMLEYAVDTNSWDISNNTTNIDDISIKLNNIYNIDIETLKTRIKNVSSYVMNVSSRVQDVSSYVANLATLISEAITYDDTQLVLNIEDLSTNLISLNSSVINVSSKLKTANTSINVLETTVSNLQNYDDTVLKNRIKDVSQYAINTSSRLSDLSAVVDNILESGYDDTEIKNRITDVSQYGINTSSRLNDLSTYTHNITIPESYDDTEITNKVNDLSTYTHNLVIPNSYDDTALKNRIANVSTSIINANTSIMDISTRLNDVSARLSQSGGGSGSTEERYARQNYTSSWYINRELLDTSYVEFKDFVVYTPLIENYSYPYSESVLNNSSIILRTVATGSTETDRIYLVGHLNGQYKVKMIVGGHDTYISQVGTPLNQMVDSERWYSTYNTSNYMFFSFPQKVRICSLPQLANDGQEMILFRLED